MFTKKPPMKSKGPVKAPPMKNLPMKAAFVKKPPLKASAPKMPAKAAALAQDGKADTSAKAKALAALRAAEAAIRRMK